MVTLGDKIDALLRDETIDRATLLGRAMEVGVDALYRKKTRSAYLRGDIERDEAIEVLGTDEVAELDYAIQAVTADVEWGLRGD